MTDTTDPVTEVMHEAVALIDRGLGDIQHRELISTGEVADLLLDVRLLLSTPSEDDGDAGDTGEAEKVTVGNT